MAARCSPSTASSPGGSACVHAADLISACCPRCHQRHFPAVNKLWQQREECLVGVSWRRGGVCAGQGLDVARSCHGCVRHTARSHSTLSQLRLCLTAAETLQRSEPPVHMETSGTLPVREWDRGCRALDCGTVCLHVTFSFVKHSASTPCTSV